MSLEGLSTRLVGTSQRHQGDNQGFPGRSPFRGDLRGLRRCEHRFTRLATEVVRQCEASKPVKILRVERVQAQSAFQRQDGARRVTGI